MRRTLAALAGVALAVIACSTVPYTDRTRVILMSEGEETQLGIAAYSEITGNASLSSNPQHNEWVLSAGKKIAAVASKDLQEAGRDDFAWEFKVIEDKQVNAFCLPGGKIAFYTGIMPICKDEAGVAVVMGHEVAHALARHGGERLSQQKVFEVGGAVVAAAVGAKGEATQAVVLAAYGIGTQLAFGLPFSRKHELEADHIGIMLMAQAGYDPREAPKFWQRMTAASDGQPPEWASTHPSHERRIQDLEDLVGDAIPLYEKATGKQVEYYRRVLRSDK